MRPKKKTAPRNWKPTFGEMTLLVDRVTKELIQMVDDDVGRGP